jgi:hypothetical protein
MRSAKVTRPTLFVRESHDCLGNTEYICCPFRDAAGLVTGTPQWHISGAGHKISSSSTPHLTGIALRNGRVPWTVVVVVAEASVASCFTESSRVGAFKLQDDNFSIFAPVCAWCQGRETEHTE